MDSDVVINEVLADPSGNENTDEFVELFNKGTDPVVITNWSISDTIGSTKTYSFPDTTIAPGQYVVVTSAITGISLNNTGDGVVLKKSDGTQIDLMSYDSSKEDRSWSRIPNGTGSFVNNTAKTSGTVNEAPPSSTPTNSPSPQPTNTPTITDTAASTSVVDDTENNEDENVLGVADTNPQIPTPTPTELTAGDTALGLSVLSGILLIPGIIIYRIVRKFRNKGFVKISV
jgi:hypothetical protein